MEACFQVAAERAVAIQVQGDRGHIATDIKLKWRVANQATLKMAGSPRGFGIDVDTLAAAGEREQNNCGYDAEGGTAWHYGASWPGR